MRIFISFFSIYFFCISLSNSQDTVQTKPVVTTLPNDTNVQVVQNGVFDVVWHTAGIGGLAGYQFFIKKRVSVDFLFGLGIRQIFYKKIMTGEGSVKSSLADGLFSVTLGYRFLHKNNNSSKS